MGLFSPKERKSVMEGGTQPSLVEEVLMPSLRGGVSNLTGLVDLGLMTPTMAGRMIAKGEDWRTALSKSAGLTTEALGVGAPTENTPEYYAYKAGQVLTPMPVKGITKAPAATILPQIGGNIATEALFGALPPEYAAMGAGGVLAASLGGTAYRNKLISDLTAGKVVPPVNPNMPLSLGQQTGAEAALRAEEALRQSTGMAGKVREFDRAQAEVFKNKIEALIPKTKSSDTEVSKKAFDGLNNLYKGLNTKIKANADVLFSDFYKKAGGEGKSLISSSPIINRIDEIIKSYSPTAVSNKENAAVINHLEKVKSSLLKEDGTPRNLTAFETAQQWSDYSKKSKHGENFIGDTSAKTSEEVASRLANVYETSINNLADQFKATKNKKAAEALLFAKDEYRKEMTHLGDIKALTVNGLFDVKSASALNGKDVVEAISKYSPEDRKRMITLLNSAEPEIADNVRLNMFKKLVGENAYIKGAPEAAPQFDINEVYKNYQTTLRKTPEDLEFLFPLKKDRDAFEASMRDAKAQANIQLAQRTADGREISKAIGAGALLGTGKTFGKTATSSIGELVESGKRILVGEQDLFNHLFKGVDIKSSFINKYTAPAAVKMGTEAAQAGIENRPTPNYNDLVNQYMQEQGIQQPVQETAQPTEQPPMLTEQPPMSVPTAMPTQPVTEAPNQPDINSLLDQYIKEQGYQQ